MGAFTTIANPKYPGVEIQFKHGLDYQAEYTVGEKIDDADDGVYEGTSRDNAGGFGTHLVIIKNGIVVMTEPASDDAIRAMIDAACRFHGLEFVDE